MKEHPILFSTPMVKAIIEGRKTHTRRIIKLKHLKGEEGNIGSIHKDGSGKGWIAHVGHSKTAEQTVEDFPGNDGFKCPYGEVGDTLWVRETWQYLDLGKGSDDSGYVYKASENGKAWATTEEWTWRPSIFMPRSACRIILTITDIRVERLQDITEEDAISEGVLNCPIVGARGNYEYLWGDINGPESWNTNPWVWVVEFKITNTLPNEPEREVSH